MKYRIKMIVSDLDGTLLNCETVMSERTISVLEKCRKSGIKIAYATARGRSADLVAPAKHFDGRVNMGGAVASINNEIIYSRLIPFLTARPILLACDKRGLRTASEYSGMHFSNFNVLELWPYIKYCEKVDFSLHDRDAEKLYAVIDDQSDADFIRDQLNEDLHLHVSSDNLAMIMHRDATKSKAVAVLANHWNIEPSAIAAFGDDLNDIDMLEYAGYGVAMENARDEVKAAADYSCPGNDEDGVAEWILENVKL